MTNEKEARAKDLVAALSGVDDGTGDLGVVVRQALADDPDVTADDIREIVLDARREWAEEQAYQASLSDKP